LLADISENSAHGPRMPTYINGRLDEQRVIVNL
jgi:hypothetical protein